MEEKADINQIIADMPTALLSWYGFEKPGRILYISGGEDHLSRSLKAQGRDVSCLGMEGSVSETFLSGHLGSFAYIMAVQCLEQADDPKKVLTAWRMLLSEDGTLLLGVNNRLGLCYFCGEQDIYTNRSFDGIENYRRIRMEDKQDMMGRMYARFEWEQMLGDSGFSHNKYFSVLPKLEAPQLLFSEKILPMEELGMRLFPMYHNPDTVFLEEEYLYTSLSENGMFHQMANSYLIECSLDGVCSDADQVTLSVDRGKESALATIVKDNGQVEKKPLYPEGIKRLQVLHAHHKELESRGIQVVKLGLDHGSCVMPFVPCEAGSLYLRKLFYSDIDRFVEKMDEFRDLILQSSNLIQRHVKVSELLDEEKKELGEDGTDRDDLGMEICLEHGFLDLVPLNSFYENDTFLFFDQEFMEENLPVKVLLTRLVDLTYQGDARMPYILPAEFFLKRYGLEEHIDVWRRKVWKFTARLRNERQLRSFHEKYRRNDGIVNSNRQRMNYSASEYKRIFIDIFSGLENKKLFLFGSGNFAKQFTAYYKNDYTISAILDNNQEKWGQDLNGIPIVSPETITQLEPYQYKIIICIKNYVGVMKQLKLMGTVNYAVYDTEAEYQRRPAGIPGIGITGRRKSDFVEPDMEPNGSPGGTGTGEVTGKKYHIGYIAGVFDLYHIGHLNMFKRAKEQCDYLIVGVVTDEGVRRNKKTDPFIPFSERIELVRACRYVDEAVEIPLDYNTTRDAYRLYRFDAQFSGSDYADNPDWLADKQFLENHGAEMVFFPYTEGTSSSKIKEVISRQLL
ncbi:adenylyltransferase/cytidyltransferase family protein [Enterocloster sp. OA13]|uniref:adenylyltransferase/cytidyltransferase family protein n=1 Tax=Enterocloster sp. OA13 TaxID=2914161 RepID=UPI00046E9B88|nr:adenylyltransferase/cytidyltransferase family protein [Enterocloster sp. OA13]